MQVTLYRLRLQDKVVGWALPAGRWCIVLLYGAPPRGLWLYDRAWLDGAKLWRG